MSSQFWYAGVLLSCQPTCSVQSLDCYLQDQVHWFKVSLNTHYNPQRCLDHVSSLFIPFHWRICKGIPHQSAFLYLALFSLAVVHSLTPTASLPFLAFQQVSGSGLRNAMGIPSLCLLVAGPP